MRKLTLILLAAALMPALAFAQEAVEPVAPSFLGQLWANLQPFALEAIVILIGAVIAYVQRQKYVADFRKETVGIALDTAVNEVGIEIVNGLKAAAADGKLNFSEAKRAQETAIKKAQEIALKQGVDAIEFYGKRVLGAMVNRIVDEQKGADVKTAVKEALVETGAAPGKVTASTSRPLDPIPYQLGREHRAGAGTEKPYRQDPMQ